MNPTPVFDPIAFLRITSVKDKETVTKRLFVEISNYLAVRFIEILPTEVVIYLKSQEKVFEAAQKHFPDFNDRVRGFMEDFRKEYLQEAKVE